VDNYVLVLTDGHSNILPEQTPVAASQLQQVATVMAVGVGIQEDVNRAEINDIATNPDNRNTFFLQNESQISSVASGILDELC